MPRQTPAPSATHAPVRPAPAESHPDPARILPDKRTLRRLPSPVDAQIPVALPQKPRRPAGNPAGRDCGRPRNHRLLYRIAQEAITNAVKHGRAKSIVVSLNSSPDESTLTITDDGSGFPAGASATGGLGLRIMKYRAQMIGASLRIRPADSKGTTVACSFRINR